MKCNTLHFGEIEISKEQLLDFPQGLPGFEEYNQFALLQFEEEQPFAYLQSVDNSNISFVVAPPFFFFVDYEFDLTESIKDELHIRSESDVMVLGIITVHHESFEATMNLLAPIIVNPNAKRAKQIILHNTDYRTKHPLAQKTEVSSKEAGPSC
ncbi:flagellar assembly protein FliW [Paenibacillus sp. GD4]|uniref:flagellar assembly protein FliW n=1 Tax=Paenibacillus sp. GD4 TaxID=3068890 RepID=UPI002796AF19|nr:flagellar assembly protein FliW [Paenibacillus sp. GD4]MDQ1911280.1 flagellar assembly protein FliW [Paenibacillus sp. GD4]